MNTTDNLTLKDDNWFISQTTYSGKLRWLKRVSGLREQTILQQERITTYYENGSVSKVEVEWVTPPVEYSYEE